MWRFLSLFLFSLLTGSLHAQEGVNVRIEVRTTDRLENVFITGSRDDLGQWKPDEVSMEYGYDIVESRTGSLSECLGGRAWPDYYFIELTDVVDDFEFKVTLGDWSKEGRVEGRTTNANYSVSADRDTVIKLKISHWGGLGSTVLGSLDIIELPDSNSVSGSRTIRVWYPRHDFIFIGRFPTVYMADGQNLFDAKTANFGEWKIDEFLYGFKSGPWNAIVVGIDNSPNRSQEYMDTELGEAYRAFVTEVVIPYVDSAYNTIPEREYRVAAGSSAGGTVSFLHAIYDSEYFAGAMCFSPALQLQTENYDINLLPLLDDADPFVFYMDMGGEGVDSILHPGCMLIDERLSNDEEWSNFYLGYRYVPEHDHNEAAWAERFPVAYLDMIQKLGWSEREY